MEAYESPLVSMRLPPHNIAAEQALLGALLANNRGYERVSDIIAVPHFADPINGRIYQSIARLMEAGRVADPITLRTEFEHAGILDEVGGAEYLARLVTAMTGLINVADYARVIRDTWVRRTLIGELGPLIEQCFSPPEGGTPAILEAAEASLLRIALDAGDDAPTVSIGNAVRDAVAGAQAAAHRGDALAGVDTGYGALNRMLMGLIPGNLVLCGARPSMGKTGLALGVAARVAAFGKRVLFWSGEMTAAQLGARAAAAFANLDTVAVFTARKLEFPDWTEQPDRIPLTPRDWQDLREAEAAAARLPLEIDQRSGITVAQLRARSRRMKRQKGGLHLVVADYMGLMRGSEAVRRQGSRYLEQTEISADLKALAKELGVPVLALCQLNRQNETREDKRPTMADLRDSGALEQDADAIMLLHRPHYYLSRASKPERHARELDETYANRCSELALKTKNSEGVAEIMVTKNRHGPTGVTRLRFTDRTTWFRDETEDDISAAWPHFLELGHGA